MVEKLDAEQKRHDNLKGVVEASLVRQTHAQIAKGSEGISKRGDFGVV